ncbi:MAG: hypothetical protein Tsb0017_18290 [Geothermobacteraceae bacterium]
MPYARYFRPEQKLTLRPLAHGESGDIIIDLSAFVLHFENNRARLQLPYDSRPGEDYPFEPGMPVELVGEALGLGIRVSGTLVASPQRDQVEIELNADLQAFQRRLHPRADVRVGLRYTRGHGALRTFRNQWEKNVRILAGKNALDKLGHFPRVDLNLGTGGVRFGIKTPVQVADLCMLLIQLEPTEAPICALAEVVWLAEEETEEVDRRTAGLKFINILKSDQKRIEQFLRDHRAIETKS